MPEANGEYVKVYLLLLRCQASPNRELTISGIADILDDTEKDVIRALKYWKKQGLLDYEITEEPPLPPPGQTPRRRRQQMPRARQLHPRKMSPASATARNSRNFSLWQNSIWGRPCPPQT